MEFDTQQKDAINTISGPVMVVSCPGSGKTSVIVERTNKIIQSGIESKKVMVVTFSKAAASEMEERFIEQYGKCNVNFRTIHSICYSILAQTCGLKASNILKDSEKKAFLRDMYFELKEQHGEQFEKNYKDIDEYYSVVEAALSIYALKKYMGYNIENMNPNGHTLTIFSSYLKFKKKFGKIDFDDMIIECHKCLKSNKEVLKYWQNMVDYIMIDEYQDTSILQAEIFFMLAGEQKNICVVGDDDQSIYGFRGAEPDVFNKFLNKYPETKKKFLETNYRSDPQIIRQASCLIKKNKKRIDKQFTAYKNGKGKIEIVSVDTSVDQTNQIIHLLREYQKRGTPLNTIAILYRVKREARLILSRLQSEKIPFYTKELPSDIYNGMVYKDIKAYYRLANDMSGSTDLRQIINRPKRYIKAEAVENCALNKEKLLQNCMKGIQDGERKEQLSRTINKLFLDLSNLRGKRPIDLIMYLLNDMKYREGLLEYANFLKIDSKPLLDEFDELTEESKLFSSMFEWDEHVEKSRKEVLESLAKMKDECVYLSTFHGSKGLEWDNVIMISANDGVTPLVRNDAIENPEEERRLFYVAATRAKKELSIICYGNNENRTLPSRYIDEMGCF